MTRLTRWEPFRDLISLREAMDRLFEDSVVRPSRRQLALREGAPMAVDMYETDEDVVVKTALPGIDPDDVDVSITGDTLTIKGETRAEEEIEEENYVYRERRFGAISRSLRPSRPRWRGGGRERRADAPAPQGRGGQAQGD
jgi:HSP20 family protein